MSEKTEIANDKPFYVPNSRLTTKVLRTLPGKFPEEILCYIANCVTILSFEERFRHKTPQRLVLAALKAASQLLDQVPDAPYQYLWLDNYTALIVSNRTGYIEFHYVKEEDRLPLEFSLSP